MGRGSRARRHSTTQSIHSDDWLHDGTAPLRNVLPSRASQQPQEKDKGWREGHLIHVCTFNVGSVCRTQHKVGRYPPGSTERNQLNPALLPLHRVTQASSFTLFENSHHFFCKAEMIIASSFRGCFKVK